MSCFFLLLWMSAEQSLTTPIVMSPELRKQPSDEQEPSDKWTDNYRTDHQKYVQTVCACLH